MTLGFVTSGGGGGGGGGCWSTIPVIRPMRLPSFSVNQSVLAGPRAMYSGRPPAVTPPSVVNCPDVVIRPMLFATACANQSAPSGPTVMPS